MEGQFIFVLEGNMKLELIQVDCYGVRFCIYRHFSSLQIPLKTQEILTGPKISKKSDGSNHQEPYHMPYLMSISWSHRNRCLSIIRGEKSI